ncbi:MAG: tryptophan synthase subunit alpha [Gemmatimonadetes bacterium]|uniref:Tryptophan synthase alpha chain n=1 Tax=Candidatus Kutchimonas denitrificans TaxID=3056748 RepID=A0AAE4Z5U7_9BACT|nr:tryptophan synthase subunit alpha [Gemmatimonadota bacterium]NIR74319.1 tryptophan synthase subunit alpha [Candidatus Kutchimonas denitrificans]NIS01375.1 tryptophan synthase subunit alpha [Gemmatimonadota bacterium]NIT67115.1 tryptophan synthase subunit alpha [Gemmatimonadota bacterium]NIU52771.1 tryptophan synthase subunit alpha [Gemmatimonadota bacterium]
MTTIASAFERAKRDRRSALIAYLAAGDPDLAMTIALARAVAEAGADIIELGIPFSDPLADGPIIQAAYTRALASGISVKRIFEHLPMIAEVTETPIVLMTALNPVHAYGPDAFCRDAKAAGAAGLLIPDLLPEDASDLREQAHAAGLDTVFLAAPDTTEERLAAAAAASTGFFYLISRRGVTGPEGGVGEELEAEVARARKVCTVPIAVGFGVTAGADARRVAEAADGVIVGSAFVRLASEVFEEAREGNQSHSAARAAAAEAVKAKAQELMDGIRGARSKTARTETERVET